MKKVNYMEKAEKMIARGVQFSKKPTKIGAVRKSTEFANAYAKLARTPEACNGWITALKTLKADKAIIAPFIAKLESFNAPQQISIEEAV